MGWLAKCGGVGLGPVVRSPRSCRVDQEPGFDGFVLSGLSCSHLILLGKGYVHLWAFRYWVVGPRGISFVP